MARTSSRPVVGALAVALVALLACNTQLVCAQAKKSDSVVKAEARADKPDADGKQTVTLTLDIEKPWHLYANPVGNEDLAEARTVVSFSAKDKIENAKVEYPAGKIIVDAAVGNYKVYEGKITIKATLKRTKGDDSPLEVTIKLQACDDKRCLLPATVKVTAN
jgi:DsbC/DsbD-like thiol-disulfide interchange protein